MSRNGKKVKSLLSQQTQCRCPGLLVENPHDFRGLYSPSNAHTFGRRCDESGDDYSLGDSSDDEDEAMFLGRAAIGSSQNMMKSTSNDNINKMKTIELELQDSLMYSEDEGTAAQKSCLDQSRCSEGSTVFSNSRTLHSGTFLEEALNQAQRSSSSTFSSFESEESSICGQQDHYFSSNGFSQVFRGENVCHRISTSTGDEDEPIRIGTASNSRCSSLEGKLNNRSFESDFFIFSDDDGSTESKTRTSQNQQPRDTLLRNGALQDITISESPWEDESYKQFVASIQAAHNWKIRPCLTGTETLTDETKYALGSPVKCDQLNREQGGSMASRMLNQKSQKSRPNLTEGSGETVSLSSDSGSSSLPRYAKSLLGRVFGGRRWTRTSSPLDHVVEISNSEINDGAHNFSMDSTHRVSGLAVATLTGSSTERNFLADFAEWESTLSCDSDAKKETRLHSTYLVVDESSDEEANEEKSVFVIKAVSLLAQDFVDSIARPAPSMSQNLALDARDGLFEPRITTEDIATALDMSGEGRQLLTHIRGRAGVIDDPEQDLEDETNGSGQLPWIQLHDNVWMPHYEEYVVRSVYRFQKQLQTSMAVAVASASDRSGVSANNN